MAPISEDKEPRISKLPRLVLGASAVMDREDEAVANMEDEELHDLKRPKWDVIEE
jgi:hypothetical protein